jgi:hypothetical protein
MANLGGSCDGHLRKRPTTRKEVNLVSVFEHTKVDSEFDPSQDVQQQKKLEEDENISWHVTIALYDLDRDSVRAHSIPHFRRRLPSVQIDVD